MAKTTFSSVDKSSSDAVQQTKLTRILTYTFALIGLILGFSFPNSFEIILIYITSFPFLLFSITYIIAFIWKHKK